MSVSVSVAGPYFSSGSISFSSLRSTFKGTSSGEIRASEYKRNTSIDATDPIVPDSTENSAVSSGYNLALSQFRNTIKYYNMTQDGQDINFYINSQPWNGNLDRNIRKRLDINGTCGSNSTGSPAAQLSSGVNIAITVNGSILGAGGAMNGGRGGDAFAVYGTRNTTVTMGSGVIYAGGGGGGKGATGKQGPPALCFYITIYNAGTKCGRCPSCGGDSYNYCGPVDECNCTTKCSKKGGCNTICSSTRYAASCIRRTYFNVPGGLGGEGGLGGRGQGFNQSKKLGGLGWPGLPSSCSGYNILTATITYGEKGQDGGDGGDWGQSGGLNGGAAGTAIYGSNYSLYGSNGYNIKG